MGSRYHDGFSFADRRFLDRLHYRLFGKTITNKGCSDCYRDAYALIKIQLKKNPTMAEKNQCGYRLKAGALVQFFGESTVYTNHNLTDEVAERFLKKNPAMKKLFAEMPDDWKSRIGIAEQDTQTSSTAEPAKAEEQQPQELSVEPSGKEQEETAGLKAAQEEKAEERQEPSPAKKAAAKAKK